MTAEPTTLPSRPSPGEAGARLGELYRSNARMVLGVCQLVLRDPGEAEDATQQVFLSAYRSLLVGTSVEKPGAWLATIARNECRARIEVRMRTPLPQADVDTLVGPALEEQAEGRARNATLYAELAALPVKQREAVVLRDVYGLRYDEVATVLGTSRAAVETLLFRGRRRLQHRLRPGLAAGVLVVPLALRESLAYAVPGFASTVGPVAGGSALAVPLAAKLAAVGLAVGAVGSAGVATQHGLGDGRTGAPNVTVSTGAPGRARQPVVLPPLMRQPAQAVAAGGTPAPAPVQAKAQPRVQRSDDAEDNAPGVEAERRSGTNESSDEGSEQDGEFEAGVRAQIGPLDLRDGGSDAADDGDGGRSHGNDDDGKGAAEDGD